MPNLDCRTSNSLDWKFDSGAVPVTDAASWVLIGVIRIGAKRGGMIRVEVGSGGDIGHLKFTHAGFPGDAHIDWLLDNDFYNLRTPEISRGLGTPGISIRTQTALAAGLGIANLPAGNA